MRAGPTRSGGLEKEHTLHLPFVSRAGQAVRIWIPGVIDAWRWPTVQSLSPVHRLVKWGTSKCDAQACPPPF